MTKLPAGYDSWIQVYDVSMKSGFNMADNQLKITFRTIDTPPDKGQKFQVEEIKMSVQEIKANIFDEIKHLRIHHFDAAYVFRDVFSKENESQEESRIFDLIHYLAKGEKTPSVFIRNKEYYEKFINSGSEPKQQNTEPSGKDMFDPESTFNDDFNNDFKKQ